MRHRECHHSPTATGPRRGGPNPAPQRHPEPPHTSGSMDDRGHPARRHIGSVTPACLIMAAAFLIPSVAALAQPQGAQVVRGQASLTRTGDTTVIRAADRTIINYQRFDVPAGQTVRFEQPTATSRVLNRVAGPDPSTIAGRLEANGIVYITNPAGVLFARGAVVDVGGLYAAAGRLSDADFLAGRHRFTSLSGPVENLGEIRARQVALLGATVRHAGTIVAPQGMVALLAGDEALIGQREGRFFARVNGTGERRQAGVASEGTISAPGGRVMLGAADGYAAAITHTGTLAGTDVTIRGGRDGVVAVSGTVDARGGAGQGGGRVELLGECVGLFGASIDASGPAGGGTVLIGGDVQGRGPLPQARATYLSPDSTVRADATARGDGGTIVAWSTEVSRVFGTLSARGGPAGGDGGFVETSSRAELHLRGTPDLRAPRGQGGLWLIDPEDLDIVSAPTTNVSTTPPPPATVFTSTGSGAQLDVADIVAALTGGASVEVRTGSTGPASGGTITLVAGVDLDYNGTGTNSLSLIAHRRVVIDGRILDSSPGGDSLNLRLEADSDANGTGNVIINGTVETGGGSLDIRGVDLTLAPGATLRSGGGDVAVTLTGRAFLGANLDAGAGNVAINAPLTLTGNVVITGHDVSLDAAVDSDATVRDLTVNTSGNGTTRFGGSIGATSALGALTTNADGTTRLAAGTLRLQTARFNDPVGLESDTTITASAAVAFNALVDSVAASAHDLVINAPSTFFNGPVGAVQGLGVLRTDATGTTHLNAAAVRASELDFRDDVRIRTDVTITGTASVRFGRRVDSEADESNNLTVNSPDTTFAGPVGAQAGGALGTLTTDADGTTRLGANVAAGTIVFQDDVRLTGHATLTGTVAVTFDRTVGSESTEGGSVRNLTVNSPATTFNGAVGGEATPLGRLRTDAAGISTIAGGSVQAREVEFGDAVRLADDTTITGTASVTFLGTVDSATATPRNLTIDSPATRFDGEAGSTNPLGRLRTDARGTTTINAPALVASDMDVAGPLILATDTTLTASERVTFAGTVNSETDESNDLTINSPLTVFQNLVGREPGGALGTLTTSAAGTTRLEGVVISADRVVFRDAVRLAELSRITAQSDARFEATIDGVPDRAGSLIVESPQVRFDGRIGDTDAVSLLRTGEGGTTTVATDRIRADQVDFQNAVVLEQNLTIRADTSVFFRDTLDSGSSPADLTLDTPRTVLARAAGRTAPLGALRTQGEGAIESGLELRAASLDVAGDALIGGLVQTSENQLYRATVRLSDDAILRAATIEFFGAVNSATAVPRSLTITLEPDGTATFNGPVGNTSRLGALRTGPDGRVVLAGGSVRTAGRQEYDAPLVLALGTVLTGTDITFGAPVDSDGTPRSLVINSTQNGVTTFETAVGAVSPLERLETNSDGRTVIRGATVATRGAQVYNDAVVLGGNVTLTGARVTFGGTLDSDTTARSLTVNTTGSGTTTFVGAVGQSAALRRLHTNADGVTRILAPAIRTQEEQVYADAVLVGADAVLTGTSLMFERTVDADAGATAASLTLNSSGIGTTTFAGRVGGTHPLTALATNSDGRTRIGADIAVTDGMTFRDAVLLFADATLEARGVRGIGFESTLDSEAPVPRRLTLLIDPASVASAGDPRISSIRFGSDVGSFTPLAQLILGSDRTTSATAATIVAGVGPTGTPIANYSLIIRTAGDVIMGAGQKFAVLGDLEIRAGGRVVLSDLSTLGDLRVEADSIAIRTRPGGPNLVARGGQLALGRDGGVDFVAGGTITFSTEPTVEGGFTLPAFATPEARGLSDTLDAFARRAFGELTLAHMRAAGLVLDLAAVGVSSVNLAQAFAAAAPDIDLLALPPPTPRLTSETAGTLAEAGLDVPGLTARGVPPAAARRFADAYDNLFYDRRTDPATGEVTRTPRADHIRRTLEAAWAEYAALARERASALGLRAYVEAVEHQTEARFYMDAVRDLLEMLADLALPRDEYERVKRGIMDLITFPALPAEELESAIMTRLLG